MLTRSLKLVASTARIGIAPVRFGWKAASQVARSPVLRNTVMASTLATATAGGGWWWMGKPQESGDEETESLQVTRTAPHPIPLSPEGYSPDDSTSPAASMGRAATTSGSRLNGRAFGQVSPASWESIDETPNTPAAEGPELPASDPYAQRDATILKPPAQSAPGSFAADSNSFQPLPGGPESPRRGRTAVAQAGAFAAVSDEGANEAGSSSELPPEPPSSFQATDAAPAEGEQPSGEPVPGEQSVRETTPDASGSAAPPAETSVVPVETQEPPATAPPPPAPRSTPVRTPSAGRLPNPDGAAPSNALPTTRPTTGTRTRSAASLSSMPAGGPASLAAAASAALVADTPGERRMEGIQSPTLAVEKTAPEEIQVGQPAVFEIFVRNVGKVTAHEVVVTDAIPKGTKLVEATPEYETTASGLCWNLGTLEPGQEAQLTVQLMPEAEGEIGSVAQVSFRAQASVRTICTRPELHVEQVIPPRVMIGEPVSVGITLSNTGTGAAMDVVLEEDVPQGLSHPAGTSLEYAVGTLRPGETKTLQLTLRAEAAGVIDNVLRLRGEGGISAEHSAQLEIVAPQLEVGVEGPSRRYLERQVTFDVSIANPGTAAATNVNLIAHLPKGLEFVSADNKGQYDGQQHAVYWSLEELPPQDSGIVKLTAIPVEAGEQRLRVEGQADMGLAANHEHAMQVEGASQLVFTVTDTADPIEIGAECVYEVRVMNRGAKGVGQVQLAAALPAGLEPVRGEGPTRVTIQGEQIAFAPLARLAPQEEATYRLFVRGKEDGDQVIRVQLTSDESATPVTKEESTRVYSDR